MRAPRTRILPLLLLATAAWLAAGPGGVTLQAIAACWHHPVSTGTHDGRHQSDAPDVPPGAPCFCDQMTGGNDLLVTPALPALTIAPAIVAPAVRGISFPVPLSPLPDFILAPASPPPNPLA